MLNVLKKPLYKGFIYAQEAFSFVKQCRSHKCINLFLTSTLGKFRREFKMP